MAGRGITASGDGVQVPVKLNIPVRFGVIRCGTGVWKDGLRPPKDHPCVEHREFWLPS